MSLRGGIGIGRNGGMHAAYNSAGITGDIAELTAWLVAEMYSIAGKQAENS